MVIAVCFVDLVFMELDAQKCTSCFTKRDCIIMMCVDRPLSLSVALLQLTEAACVRCNHACQ